MTTTRIEGRDTVATGPTDECVYKYCINSGTYILHKACDNGGYCRRKAGDKDGGEDDEGRDPGGESPQFHFPGGHRLLLIPRSGGPYAPGLLIYCKRTAVKLLLNLDAFFEAAPGDDGVHHFGPSGGLGESPDPEAWHFRLQRQNTEEKDCSPFVLVGGICV